MFDIKKLDDKQYMSDAVDWIASALADELLDEVEGYKVKQRKNVIKLMLMDSAFGRKQPDVLKVANELNIPYDEVLEVKNEIKGLA